MDFRCPTARLSPAGVSRSAGSAPALPTRSMPPRGPGRPRPATPHSQMPRQTNRTRDRSRRSKQRPCVVYLKGGEEYNQPADVVLLAGYTYENVRLLLLSKSKPKPFPNGLANNGGQVGRHYMSHHTGAAPALRASPRASLVSASSYP